MEAAAEMESSVGCADRAKALALNQDLVRVASEPSIALARAEKIRDDAVTLVSGGVRMPGFYK